MTSTADVGAGTLRAQVAAAGANDVIVFAPEIAGSTITLGSPIDVGVDVTLEGAETSAGQAAELLAQAGEEEDFDFHL